MKFQYNVPGGAFYKCDKCNGGLVVTRDEYPKELSLYCEMCDHCEVCEEEIEVSEDIGVLAKLC